MQYQRTMTTRREDLSVRQCPVGQLHEHVLKLGLCYLACVVLKDSHDTPLHQVKGKRVEVTDITQQAIILVAHKRVF